VLRSGAISGTTRGAIAPATDATREQIQQVMTHDAGVLRDAASLTRASAALDAISPVEPEVVSLWEVSRALVRSALAREESRGTHTRLDFPETSPDLVGRLVYAGGAGPSFVGLPDPVATR